MSVGFVEYVWFGMSAFDNLKLFFTKHNNKYDSPILTKNVGKFLNIDHL